MPIDWNATKICRYMTETELRIRRSSGFCAAPNRKIGCSLSNSIVEMVQNVYELDENSCVMAGKKDCISIMIIGKTCPKKTAALQFERTSWETFVEIFRHKDICHL